MSCNVLINQGRVRNDTDQRSLELPNVRIDLVGDIHHRFVRNVEILRFGLLAQNGNTGLQIRRLNISDKSPFEP